MVGYARPLSMEEAQELISVLDNLVLDGAHPPNKNLPQNSRKVMNEAPAILKIARTTLISRLDQIERLYRIAPIWRRSKNFKVQPKNLDQKFSDIIKILPRVEPRPAQKRVIIMTAAQDETRVVDGALNTLEALAGHYNAEIFIGGFTYQKGLFEDHSVRSGVFTPEVTKYLRPEVIEIAPRLVWYGKANIQPTSSNPLSGWETATRDSWAVFPHAKVALQCVPTMPGAPGKQIMTTGVVTRENYIQKNSGQKAEFHHTVGAIVAEVSSNGSFFCRQVKVNPDRTLQDLDVVIRDGQVTTGNSVEAIVWGDIHIEELNAEKSEASWGFPNGSSENMFDVLKPRHQFIHDSFSFKARSHHTKNDPHERASRLVERCDSVGKMLKDTAIFLYSITRPWCRTVHVASNHNLHLHQWLKDPDGRMDPVNARIWHELNAKWHEAIEKGDDEFSVHEYALREAARSAGIPSSEFDEIIFLHEGESYLICQGKHPIECGLHGHIGPRGARGSPANLSRIVERVFQAHTHEPGIRGGNYCVGTSSDLDPSYASRGPGAWHLADGIAYPGGARTIITLQNGKWRA